MFNTDLGLHGLGAVFRQCVILVKPGLWSQKDLVWGPCSTTLVAACHLSA